MPHQDDITPAFENTRALMKRYSAPGVVEIILERVTNIAMGADIDAIKEFNDVLDVT